MLETGRKAEQGAFQRASLEELQEWNRRLYEDIIGDAYEYSYANPAYAVRELTEDYGTVLSFVYTELRGMIVYAFEGRLEEMLICMELFLQIHSEFCGGSFPSKEQLLSDVYWFVSDYSDVFVTRRVREQLDPSLSFARDIIMEADLKDPRYLYQFGEYINDTQIGTSRYLAGLTEEEIRRMASVFTEGYRMGFVVSRKPLERKKTVNIRYCLGFERIIRQAVRNFQEMGLEEAGAPGTTAALALLNDNVKKGGVMASSYVGGLSGAFIPVSEDHGMIDAARKGALTLEKLEAMTCVCSVGLDMIALPGDTSAATLSGIIADEAAIGMVNNKTTAVRLIPVIGRKEGDTVEFGGLLGYAPIIPINRFNCEKFIARGGRIPAPIHSFKN